MEGRYRFAVLSSPLGLLGPAALLCAQRSHTRSSNPQTPMKDCPRVQAVEGLRAGDRPSCADCKYHSPLCAEPPALGTIPADFRHHAPQDPLLSEGSAPWVEAWLSLFRKQAQF